VTARYDELLACGVEPAAVARRWPEGLPPPRKAADMHLDQLIAAADLLERLGDERGQPFGEPRPDRPQPQLRHVAEADIRPPLRPAPDEGPEIGAAEADMVRAEFAALDDTIRHDVARWAMEAGRAGRTWTMQRNGKPVTLRRRQTSGAALSLARLADGDDAVARAALAVVIGEDECQTHPVGALLGTLTIEEAGKLTQVAEGCTLTLADDGAPVIGVAS
jgi:hypothetical protein